ncbi:MAG: hypothetical protein ACREL5_00415 [Gemmatimonadales bacterium]
MVLTKPIQENLCHPDEYHFPGCECPPYCIFPDSSHPQIIVTFVGSPPDGDDGDPFIIPLNTVHGDPLGHRPPKPTHNGHEWDSTLTFTIEVDTNGRAVPSVRLRLAIDAADSGGAGSDSLFGHFHYSGTTPKPKGSLSPDSIVTTDSATGKATVTYTPGQYSEPIHLVISSPAFDTTAKTHWTVGVPDLDHMSGSHVDLVGEDTPLGSRHPHSHYVISTMIPTLDSLADYWLGEYGNLQINDMSLRYGGKFDLDTLWRSDPPGLHTCKIHCEHRLGRSADINGLSVSDTVPYHKLVHWWHHHGAGLFDFPEGGKAHLRDWRTQ